MRLIAAVTLAIGLASCTSVGIETDQKKVAPFERGKTTYSDAVRALGEPTASLLSDDGSRVAIYANIKSTSRQQGITLTYTLTFDENELLETVRTGTSQTTESDGLAN
jgi:hypothetical protein